MVNISPKIHDARIMLQLPSSLKAELTAAANARQVPVNELIREAIKKITAESN